jgi:hypothetical protein
MMKRSLLYPVLIITLFTALASCSKNANTTTNNNGLYSYMKCSIYQQVKGKYDTIYQTVNGHPDTIYKPIIDTLYQTWSSDLTLATAFAPNIVIVGSKSSDSKTGKAGQAIGFTINNYPGFNTVHANGAGTYVIDGINNTAYWSYDGINKTQAVSGKIIIINGNAESASGTFAFVFADSTTIQGSTSDMPGTFSVLW